MLAPSGAGEQESVSFTKSGLRPAPSSRTYFTLTNSPSYESLLLHRVPSPSLCLEEMLELWPRSPLPRPSLETQLDDAQSLTSPLYDRDSITTFVDFGNWVSRQSHNHSLSLLPPAPEFLQHEFFGLNSDSVECRLSSTAQRFSEIKKHQDPNGLRFSNQNTTSERLTTLCNEFNESSFESDYSWRPTMRTLTPVPSLVYSRCSADFTLAADARSSETRVSVSSNCPHTPPPNRETIMDTISPRAFKRRPDTLNNQHGCLNISPPLPSPSVYEDDSFGTTLIQPKSNQSAHDQNTYHPFRPVPTPNINGTQLHIAEPQIPSNENEISYIDWDDNEDRTSRGGSRLARMKKSINDLRAAERFIAEAAARRNTPSIKTSKYNSTGLATNETPIRPDTISFSGDNTLISMHQHRQQQFGKHRDAHSAPADKVSTCETSEYNAYTSLSPPSKQRSIHIAPGRLRKQASGRSISRVNHSKSEDQQSPPGQIASAGAEDEQIKRHRRRTVSSELEGFSLMPPSSADCHSLSGARTAATISDQTSTARSHTPNTATLSKRKRFSTSISPPDSRAENTVSKDKDSKRLRLSSRAVGQWVKRVFGGKNAKTRR